jgi:hypothetical protein
MKEFFLWLSILGLFLAAAFDAFAREEAVRPQGDLPRVVAVMPFQNESDEPAIASQVRKTFYNHFSSKPYRAIKLPLVDEKIVQLEKSTGKRVIDLKPQEIGQAIECDGLLYGNITDYKKIFAAVYSQLGLEVEVWLVHAKTGKEVFRIKDSVRYHGGSVPTSPLGAIMTVFSAAINLREIQQIRLLNELCHKLNEKIPAPAGVPVEDRPVISEVLTNAKEGPFGRGKVVRVGLEGDKGLVATFSIGNFQKGIIMKETKPGIYMGEYMVLPGDGTEDMPVIASLKRPGGYETQWYDPSGLITIDTVPPPQILSVKAKGFQDRIDIAWEAPKGVADLRGYSILRSEQPLSGYTEVNAVESNRFSDKDVKPDIAYYYRVIAFDQAGNRSVPQDPVRGFLLSKEPVILPGELTKDTVLSGVYRIREDLIVPKGLSLTIEPGTTVLVEEGRSIRIHGALVVDSRDDPVEFFAAGSGPWKGIAVVDGRISVSGLHIKGAEIGMSLSGASGFLENAMITDNSTAISIAGTTETTIKNSTFSGNKTGLELNRASSKVVSNNIIQNREGIVLKEFSGEILDNVIMDNEKNIVSESPTKIGPNYFGSINVDEMRIRNVTIEKVYDKRPPEGKIVEAVVNPYARLTEQERLVKSAQLLEEAGQYFRQRNYGKSSLLYEEAIKVNASPEAYYYLALCFQEMKEGEKAMKYLQEGTVKFPRDSNLWKSLGMIFFQAGKPEEARRAFQEVIRLNPDDRQVKFLLESMEK